MNTMATMTKTEGCNIPEDFIISEILIQLPVKSLLRFRSVCKAWRSAISNRYLIELHRQHSQSKVHLMHCSHNIPNGDVSITIERLTEEGKLQFHYRLPYPQHYGIINSSHDLVVLIYHNGYMLSNPAIQDLVYLPCPPSWDVDDVDFPVTVSGFGFVSSHGKYKVINITCNNDDTQDTCEVFTVGIDKSWRKGKSPPSFVAYGHTPYVDGNLHILSLEYKGSWCVMDILQFNLKKEAWSVMALPDETRRVHWDAHLREIQGQLSFSYFDPAKSIEIWVLRDYANKAWSKDFVIGATLLEAITNTAMSAFFLVFPLEVLADGRILVEMSSRSGRRWFYFDPRGRSCQLADQKDLLSVIYAENLVAVLGF